MGIGSESCKLVRSLTFINRKTMAILQDPVHVCLDIGNVNADALSCSLLTVEDSEVCSAEGVVAVLNAKKMDLATLQWKDKDLIR